MKPKKLHDCNHEKNQKINIVTKCELRDISTNFPDRIISACSLCVQVPFSSCDCKTRWLHIIYMWWVSFSLYIQNTKVNTHYSALIVDTFEMWNPKPCNICFYRIYTVIHKSIRLLWSKHSPLDDVQLFRFVAWVSICIFWTLFHRPEWTV